MYTIKYETFVNEAVSDRIYEISDAFGIGVDSKIEHVICNNLEISDFNVLYITGMSGSGKSSLLKRMVEQYSFIEPKIDEFSNKPIVDCIGKNTEDALYYLNVCGLGEAFLYIKPYKLLSEGQKYRFKIAKIIESNQDFWFIDEFCSFLDRDTAKIVSYNIQKIARKLGKKLVVATAHNDLLDYLRPDIRVDFKMGGEPCVYDMKWTKENPFLKDIVVTEGSIEDYNILGKYHYKNTSAKFIKNIYKMEYKGMVVGVAVYSCPKQSLLGRNIYTNKKYLDKKGVPILKEINKDFVSGSRFIIHPMFRGIGLGSMLVRETSKLVEAKYIEICSVMSKYNKFLDNTNAVFICDNMTEQTKKKLDKVVQLFSRYNLNYEKIISVDYCKKIINTIPEEELKNVIYPILRPNYFNNKARFKKYGINFTTKKEFMETKLIPELLALAKFASVEYYIIDKTKSVENG